MASPSVGENRVCPGHSVRDIVHSP